MALQTGSEARPATRAASSPPRPAARALASSPFTRKGTPPGRRGHRLHELRRGVGEPLVRGHLLHAVLVQGGQHLDAGERAGLDAVGQVRVGSRLPAGARAGDHQPQVLEALREVHEQLQRLAVHPLEVVHGHQHHLILGQPAHEPRQPMEHGVARGHQIIRLDPGQEGRGRSGSGQELSPAERVRLGQARLEELARHAEREAHLQLASAASQSARPEALRHPPDLRQQPRLPDAGRPVEEQQRAVQSGRRRAPRPPGRVRPRAPPNEPGAESRPASEESEPCTRVLTHGERPRKFI